jgi:hypothetical protein
MTTEAAKAKDMTAFTVVTRRAKLYLTGFRQLKRRSWHDFMLARKEECRLTVVNLTKRKNI